MYCLSTRNYYVVILNGMKAVLTEFPSFSSKANKIKKKLSN